MTVYNLKTPAPEPTEADILAAKKAEQEKNVKAVAKGIGVFVKPLVLMLLWNWLMPGLFGLQTIGYLKACLLYTSPSPRDYAASRMPSSA